MIGDDNMGIFSELLPFLTGLGGNLAGAGGMGGAFGALLGAMGGATAAEIGFAIQSTYLTAEQKFAQETHG
jgi:hypothetical protein